VSRPERNWDRDALSLERAQQDAIAEGDIVRSYDFPGSRDDCYLEGVVEKIEDERDRLLIHVTREVWEGKDVQVSRFKVWAPLGVSLSSSAPCVFLIAKRKVRT
jgi:hypothetical protein